MKSQDVREEECGHELSVSGMTTHCSPFRDTLVIWRWGICDVLRLTDPFGRRVILRGLSFLDP